MTFSQLILWIYEYVFIGLLIRYRWLMNTLSLAYEYIIVFIPNKVGLLMGFYYIKEQSAKPYEQGFAGCLFITVCAVVLYFF